MTIALIDGDVLRYRACYSFQKTNRYLSVNFDGEESLIEVPSKKVAREICKEEGITDFDQAYSETFGLNGTLGDCITYFDHLLDEICEAVEATDYLIFLSGPTNYRLDIDPSYKANRKGSVKPLLYEDLTQYIISNTQHVISDMQEADDDLYQYSLKFDKEGKEAIICTVDKDLWTRQGLRYNWSKPQLGVQMVSEYAANLNFLKQMIEGDAVDNVQGLRGTRAEPNRQLSKQIEELESEYEGWCWSNPGPLHYIIDLYKERFGPDKWEEQLTKTANLLWLRAEPGIEDHPFVGYK